MNRVIKFRAWDKKDKVMREVYGMQFTGLKDKNGKEIYEGDIVETPHKLMKKYKWQVIFHKGAFVLSDSIGFRYFYGKKYTQKYEVIGNRYENPELLK